MKRKHREVWYLNYGITRERLMELRAVCRQYYIMKHKLRTGTEEKKVDSYRRRVAAIEDCAGSVDPVIAPYIIGAVSRIHWDFGTIRPPCGERQFRKMIHVFYALLDMELE